MDRASAIKKKQHMMGWTISILILLYLGKTLAVWRLRKIRNRISLRERSGQLRIIQINNLIDLLNGYFLWNQFQRLR